MTDSDDNSYRIVKDEAGEDLLCPINEGSGQDSGSLDKKLDCFEKDVAERYSGNIITIA